MSDLFNKKEEAEQNTYSAKDIEVLEGLEPVRKRPGMYIGGTDENALHHLVSEIFDNSMDEAVAGHATRIEITLEENGWITISDNGRGIPVDQHPKYPGKSALEVILTTLHSGGKFSNKAYATSGGLHGVGISVVNALSSSMYIEVARDKTLYRQDYARGIAQGNLENLGSVSNRRGTTVSFLPDTEIFGSNVRFRPRRLYKMARSKAYLFKGVEIRWRCHETLIENAENPTPTEDVFKFPNGLLDFLNAALEDRRTLTATPFNGQVTFPDNQGRAEFALAWPTDEQGFSHSYCNTIPTPQGGTHESGLRSALLKAVKSFGEMAGNKKASSITADDLLQSSCILLSVFIPEPQFQGQTKDKLTNSHVTRLIDNAVRDHLDHWLTSDPASATKLLEFAIEKAETRLRRRQKDDMKRKSATKRLRLPGKLADCSNNNTEDTEIFIVEGDSAGGSAKQARNRKTQAILPLRGKVLNVISATNDKIIANQEISNIAQALGVGLGKNFDLNDLRYERVIIMTDADVDGAHIAALLVSFFFDKMPGLIESGRLFLALPPLYRISGAGISEYARDDLHKEELLEAQFKNRKVEISRFKGLGEMMPAQLKETTMDPEKRNLMRITIVDPDNDIDPDGSNLQKAMKKTESLIDQLLGKKPELRFQFIQENASFAQNLDI